MGQSVRPVRPTRWSTGGLVRCALSALAALALTATGVAAGPERAQAQNGCVPAPCSSRLHFGVSTPGLPNDLGPLDQFTQAAGVNPDIGLTFTSFRYPMRADKLGALAAGHRMPMVTWEPFDPTQPTVDRYPLRSIVSGEQDDYLRAQARTLRDLGTPVAVRFGHEMNADWYPWGVRVNGNTPLRYVQAYRHVHDVVRAEGATNVVWVWSPAALDPTVDPDLAAMYPGDDYVDWVGLSAYFDDLDDTYARTVAPTMRKFDEVAPSKPVYLAETAVLPGPQRPAMVRDLVSGLVGTPRTIGLTWFEIPSRQDWRIAGDPAALAALREGLSSGWFVPAVTGSQSAVTEPSPVNQVPPRVTGTPLVGQTLVADLGRWREVEPGDTVLAAQWQRCPDTGDTGDCVPIGVTAASYPVTDADLGSRVRLVVRADNAGGTTTVAASPSPAVLTTPDRPAAPQVDAYGTAARLVFPTPPRGTTAWRILVDGSPLHLVPVDRADYWLTGLRNSSPTSVSLAAVSASRDDARTSEPVVGTVVALPASYAPYVVVRGDALTATLPTPPAGTTTWVLELDGDTHLLPAGTRTWSATHLTTGEPHVLRLRAGAGSWPGGALGGLTPGSRTTVTPLGDVAVTVTAGAGSATVHLDSAPAAATAWRVTVGPTVYPNLSLDHRSFEVTGLYPGYPATWKVEAVNDTARSAAVTGTVTPTAG